MMSRAFLSFFFFFLFFFYFYYYYYYYFFFFWLFRATLAAYGVSQARIPIGSTAASLHHSSQQHQILNPLNEARDRTHNLMVTSQIRFCCTTAGTPRVFLIIFDFCLKR